MMRITQGYQLLSACAVLLGLLTPASTYAENTGGVFGPGVNDGHRSTQYRIAHDLENHALAQRLHYQWANNDTHMMRVVVQGRKQGNDILDFDFVQGELFWQLKNPRPNWSHGFRFDIRLRDGDRPQQIGLNWMHDIQLNDNWLARVLALSVVQFGDNDSDDVILQARGSISRRLTPRTQLALSLFANLGDTDDVGFKDSSQQLGPTLFVNLGRRWQIVAGYLAGLNQSSSDHQVRFWLTRNH